MKSNQLKTVYLRRLETSDHGTFGRLYVDDQEAFYTMELPWRANMSNKSDIPDGIYHVNMVYSDHFKKKVYLLDRVPNRWGICIHAANYAGDLLKGYKSHLNGCIALGEKIGSMEGQKALLLSRPAIRRFETLMNEQSFLLEVKTCYQQ